MEKNMKITGRNQKNEKVSSGRRNEAQGGRQFKPFCFFIFPAQRCNSLFLPFPRALLFLLLLPDTTKRRFAEEQIEWFESFIFFRRVGSIDAAFGCHRRRKRRRAKKNAGSRFLRFSPFFTFPHRFDEAKKTAARFFDCF